MNNPPRKPSSSSGFKTVWVRPSYDVQRRYKVTKSGRRKAVLVSAKTRAGHWRQVPISIKAQSSRAKGGVWISAQAYLRELESEWDLANMDPIYRYHPGTDLVRSLSNTSQDPLHNLVWGTPFSADNLQGRFRAVRLWYIVRDTNLDRHYLYGRTAHLGNRIAGSLKGAKQYVDKLMDEVRIEYDEKIYMEVVRFVAWTVYSGAKIVKKHNRRRAFSKEKGFDFDERTWKMRRIVTPWEKKMVLKAFEGRHMAPPVLAKSYGGSYKRFQSAMARLGKGERKRANEYISWAVGEMEKALDKRRVRKT